MANLQTEFRRLKKSIGQTSKRTDVFYIDCIIQCLDLIAKFDIRKSFEKYMKTNEHLFRQVVNLFNIHKLQFNEECPIFLGEMILERLNFRQREFKRKNLRIFRVIIKYIQMEKRDYYFSTQLISLFLIVTHNSGFSEEKRESFIGGNFSFFFYDMLEVDNKNLDNADYLINVIRNIYEPMRIFIIPYIYNIETAVFILNLLGYIRNYISLTTNMFLKLAATHELAALNREILEKYLKNCMKFLKSFDKISPHECKIKEKVFGECILSTVDLCYLYYHIFNSMPSFILRFQYFYDSIFTDREAISKFIVSLSHSRKINVPGYIFGPRAVTINMHFS